MTYLVAFHGLPRAGKGTAAAPLIARGFTHGAFGDHIYVELSEAFGVKIEDLRSHEWKTQPINMLSTRCCDSPKYRAMLEAMGENPNVPRTSRYHLQRWATEFRRNVDPMYWVNKLDEKLRGVSGHIVVDDLRRYPVDTEYPYLRNFAQKTGRDLRVIEILRPDMHYAREHASDAQLPFHLIDFTVENLDGAAEVMQGEILNYLFPTGE